MQPVAKRDQSAQMEPRFITLWTVGCLLCASIVAWATRYQMNPDGLSYIDIASEALRAGPSSLVNGYWSPGYPALIAVILGVTRPSPEWEFPVVHFLNFGLFGLALWGFRSFLIEFLNLRRAGRRRNLLAAFGFLTFLCMSLEFLGPAIVTPDLLVAGLLWMVYRLAWGITQQSGYWKYGALGLLLSCCYYAKTAMFVLGAVFLVLLAIGGGVRRVSRAGLVLCTAVFLAASAPLAIAISARIGRPSIGEAGRLNYIWYVNHRDLTNEEGWRGGFGDAWPVLRHGPRVLVKHPLTTEFDGPVPGTYPIWYEPDYWWEGAAPRFELSRQLIAIENTLAGYARMLPVAWPWLAGLAALFVLERKYGRKAPRVPMSRWPLLWPAAAIVVFGLVHVEGRFVAPFLTLLCLCAYRAWLHRVRPAAGTLVLALVSAALFLSVGVVTLRAAWHTARETVRPAQTWYVIVSRGLESAGVRPGDKLAVVGSAFDAYFARYGRTRLAAQILDEQAFWSLSAAERDQIARQLGAAGLRAIVSTNRPQNAAGEGWRDIPNENGSYSIRLLPIDAKAAVALSDHPKVN